MARSPRFWWSSAARARRRTARGDDGLRRRKAAQDELLLRLRATTGFDAAGDFLPDVEALTDQALALRDPGRDYDIELTPEEWAEVSTGLCTDVYSACNQAHGCQYDPCRAGETERVR